MGYDLHIVRQNDWNDDEEESNISLEEWLAYVQSDGELKLTNGYLVKVPGVENAIQNVPGFCDWLGHPTLVSDDRPWFDYRRGMISTKSPDDETIKKMIFIAEKLGGKVRGDDGEFYDADYILNSAKASAGSSSDKSDKKKWWKFW